MTEKESNEGFVSTMRKSFRQSTLKRIEIEKQKSNRALLDGKK